MSTAGVNPCPRPRGATFCGEENELLVDVSVGRRRRFTEDCAVCCRPNLITLVVGEDGEAELQVAQEYEA